MPPAAPGSFRRSPWPRRRPARVTLTRRPTAASDGSRRMRSARAGSRPPVPPPVYRPRASPRAAASLISAVMNSSRCACARGDVLAPVQRRRQLAAMPRAAGPTGATGGPQDRLEPLGRRRRRADRGELLQVLGDLPFVPGSQDRLDVREVLVQGGPADAAPPWRSADIVRPVSPRSLTSAAVASRDGVANRVAVRGDRLAPDPRHPRILQSAAS